MLVEHHLPSFNRSGSEQMPCKDLTHDGPAHSDGTPLPMGRVHLRGRPMAGVGNGSARAAKRSGPASGRPGIAGSGVRLPHLRPRAVVPGYFGHNWDALVDCLHDWHGPGRGNQDLAILIEHADDLLNSDFLGLFASVLAQAAWNSNLRLDSDDELDEWRQRIAQHFVLLLDHTAPAAFTEKAARGTDVAVALADGRLLVTLTDVDWPGGDPASAPWTAGPLSFADDEILTGMTIKALKMFRDHLGCSIHEALDILQSRSEHLPREQSDGYMTGRASQATGFAE
ncbi:barstar family protein [Streptomyces xanthochromogenes]|uniref:barstar family protein n=1 Tax=Streptomyces xanthochromogenes TaxID=67384 RepID=UPI00341E3A29